MLWSICSVDSPDAKTARERTMEAHSAYMKIKDPEIFFSGPLLNDDASGASIGSLWIVSANSRVEAQAFADNEPRHQAGVYASVNIFRTRAVHLNPKLSGQVSVKPLPMLPGEKPIWSVYASDGAKAASLRPNLRPRHSAYMEEHDAVLFFAGPALNDDAAGAKGGLWIISADSRAEVQVLVDNEPYNKAGVYESVRIHRMRGAHFHPELAGV